MPMRLSGLMSGMDTESIVQQLVEARKTKVTKAVKAQKSLKYKQDAWKDLNKQILNLYNKSLSNLRFESSYLKKTTKVSNSNVVSVITGENAMNSVQSLEVKQLAKSGFMTGGELKRADGEPVTGSTKLSELGMNVSESGGLYVTVGGEKGTRTPITVNENTTIDSFISSLRGAGVSANFDEANGRIYIASKASGEKNDFTITAYNAGGLQALNALKLNDGSSDITANKEASIKARVAGQLTAYVNQRNSLLEEKGNMVNSLKKYAFQLQEEGIDVENIDFDNITTDQVVSIGNAVIRAVEKAGEDSDMVAELGGWLENWVANEDALEELDSMITFDGDGKPVWQEGKEAEVTAEVTKEVEELMEASKTSNIANKQKAENSHIILNGVDYYSDKNTFEINGLTMTVSATTGENEVVTLTTEDDTNGIYDMIKNFIKEYSTLINQMDKLYNADSAKGYDPLTDEEKEAMSDSQIEEWETKIKDSILRKDGTLGNFANELKRIMMEGVEVNGKKMYLSNFGINTLSYFSAAENEKSAYHIDGDPDDESTSGNPDKLKAMIANDPDTVVSFFTKLSQNLYGKMFDMMKSVDGISSSMTAYEDKKMQSEYDDYTAKIKELENKLADYEDKWYAKFAAMETALAKMQNNASAVTSLLGG